MVKHVCEGKVHLERRPSKYWPTAVEITSEDPVVTVEALVQMWEMELEGENFHSMTDIPSSLVATLRAHKVEEDIIKRVLWDTIDAGGWM